jgi:hypothetical protein
MKGILWNIMGTGRSIGEKISESGEARPGGSLKSAENAEKFGKMDYTKVGDGSFNKEQLKEGDPREFYQFKNAGDGAFNTMDLKAGDKRKFYQDLGNDRNKS